ncbi:MAG: amino acid permease [Acidimicrobiales bacterium]
MADTATTDTAQPTDARTQVDADDRRLEQLGYKPELNRVLSLFQNFGVAFCYLSPVVGIFSLFVIGIGTAGPRYLWLMPIVVVGQLFVALVFAELGSHYPIAGALFQWGKNLMGTGYGWWVGWIYGWALLITVASVDTGIAPYVTSILNNWFGTKFVGNSPNTILVITLILIAIQTVFNIWGVKLLGRISVIGVWVEVLGTFGIAIVLAIKGFHHGLGYLFTTQGTQRIATNPLGVGFGGSWWLGAAFVAILAHVYIFYGFESAGDVAEEVVNPTRRVPKAIVSSLLVGFVASFILVGALILAIPAGHKAFIAAASSTSGAFYVLNTAINNSGLTDLILVIVCFAFFSCGTAVQGAGARVAFSYARDRAIPASGLIKKVSPKRETPVIAILLGAVIAALFTLLVHVSPSKSVHFLFITYPKKVNALTALVSFATSGIYLSFLMVTVAALIARLRGWRPQGSFRLGRWAYPVIVLAIAYGAAMFVNILYPSGVTSPRAVLFNLDWITISVMVVIIVIGGLYFVISRPYRRIRDATLAEHDRAEAALEADAAALQGPA